MDDRSTTEAVITALDRGETDFLHSLSKLQSWEVAQWGEPSSGKLLQSLESSSSPHPPWAYLCYYRLGSCVISGNPDQYYRAKRLVYDYCRARSERDSQDSVIGFYDLKAAPRPLWDSALELLQEGNDFVEDLEPPGPDEMDIWRAQIKSALRTIGEADHELLRLIRKLLVLIILAKPGPRSRVGARTFGGATCFFFRGATVLNASQPVSLIKTVELLVHEYAHAELFVLGQDQPLCLNSDDERHDVLIRRDPRPMNGIIHSLYVVGRVLDVMQKLLKNALKPESEHKALLADILSMIRHQADLGRSSLEVVERHAMLTPLGQRIVAISSLRLNKAEA